MLCYIVYRPAVFRHCKPFEKRADQWITDVMYAFITLTFSLTTESLETFVLWQLIAHIRRVEQYSVKLMDRRSNSSAFVILWWKLPWRARLCHRSTREVGGRQAAVSITWWRHQMETFSALPAFMRGTTGHRRIPLTRVSDAELWCFLWSVPE